MGYWLKLYTDILIDKKYFKLSEKAKTGMYEMMIVAKSCENGELTGLLPDIEEIAFQTRRPIDECQAIIEELRDVGFISDYDDGLLITNYIKRQQAIPDEERAKQYRKRQNNEMMENKTESSRELTIRDGERKKEYRENTEYRENEEDTVSQPNFFSKFQAVLGIPIANNIDLDFLKDLMVDFGEDKLLNVAKWFRDKDPKCNNMRTALKAIGHAAENWKDVKQPAKSIEELIQEA